MKILTSFARILAFVVCACLLCQCNKVNPPSSGLRDNSTPFVLPSSAYLAMANRQSGEEQQRMLLMAAGRMVYDGQWKQAKKTLQAVHTADPLLRDQQRLLLAKADLIAKRPNQAIALLAKIQNTERLAPFYQEQYHQLLAEAYEAKKLVVESVSERVKLDPFLNSESARIQNRRKLWLTLSTMPVAELDTQAMERGSDTALGGWMQLAAIARSRQEPEHLLAQLEQWRAQHHGHPANSLLPSSLPAIKPWLHPLPQQVALLLPLSGPLAGPGQAVLDGFKAARQQQGQGHMQIRTYDTWQQNISALYQQALAEGAQYVVGPLSKPEVAQLATQPHPVPTLLLNDADKRVQSNAYQFGLSPSNEARQLALKASSDGRRHALLIAPEGRWGQEVSQAFVDQWQKAGGQLVDSLNYDNTTNFNQAIEQLLHVSESEQRSAALKKILGKKMASTTRRRQDFDMIFLLAYPGKARQIMPLLRYYYLNDTPVYSISTVYGGVKDTAKNRDLDGIIFCDMPWVFQQQESHHANWPESLNSYNRLYALGMDSFALASQLNQLILFPAMGISEYSGVLYLNQAQQIARIISWGQFKEGLVEPLV
ncbi:MAG: penicillin-binding protein activator [Legionellaceae bacterium]|nr:penicillin-binding protein activator [Legionellaceae bacterium]